MSTQSCVSPPELQNVTSQMLLGRKMQYPSFAGIKVVFALKVLEIRRVSLQQFLFLHRQFLSLHAQLVLIMKRSHLPPIRLFCSGSPEEVSYFLKQMYFLTIYS